MNSGTFLKDYALYFNKFCRIPNFGRIKWMNKRAPAKEAYCPTVVEHIANILTHGIFILPSMFATHQLIERSQDSNQFYSALVYGTTLVLLFCISTFFHCVFFSTNFGVLKDTLHRCDRGMIYIFIASSYYPWLMLEELPEGGWASNMKWIIWVMAFSGIMYQQIFHEKYKWLETVFYLIMGICPVLPILSEHYFMGMLELFLGGCLYVLGVLFFKCDGLVPFAHAIWHLFVVMAAYSHYYAILNYLYPQNELSANVSSSSEL